MAATIAISNGEVIMLVVFIAAPLAAIAFAGAGAVYRQIGKGQFAMDHEMPVRPTGGDDSASKEVREAEIRQMLEAKAFLQEERGEQPLDVEAEMESLLEPTGPAGVDPALVEEVRQLVVARNERRRRRGEEPLDVEAEVARQLSELEDLI